MNILFTLHPYIVSEQQSAAPLTTLNRATIQDVRGYYEDYVERYGLRESMRERYTVTSVERMLDVCHAVDCESGEQTPCTNSHEGKFKWEVSTKNSTVFMLIDSSHH